MAVTSLVAVAPGAAASDRFGRRFVIMPCVVASSAAVMLLG
jgi:hypothetical protein